MKTKISLAAIALIILSISLFSCGEEAPTANIHTYEAAIHGEAFSVTYLTDIKTEKGSVKTFNENEIAEIDKAVSEAMKSSLLIFSERNTAGVGEINKEVDAVLDCNEKLLELINYTYTLSNLSGGRYSPAMGTVTELYASGEEIAAEALAEAITHTGTELIKIEGNDVRKSDRKAKLNFDSIACGYSIADAVAVLESYNISYAVLSYGRTVATFGVKEAEDENSKTDIAVFLNDGDDRYDGIVSFKNAVATICNEDKLVLNVETGERVESEHDTVIVYCEDGIVSNVLATMLYSMNEEEIMNFYNSRVFSFEAVAIDHEGKFFTTSDAVEYREYEGPEAEETDIQ